MKGRNNPGGSGAVITVFYDGRCGLCSREIQHYRRVASAGLFDWCDITTEPERLAREGISQADGLKRLHAKDTHGTLHTGVDAFILIWRQLKHWRVLAALVALPGIRQLAGLAYSAFAAWRFRRRG